MTFKEYQNYFQTIIDTADEKQNAPYNDPFYIEYTRLNWSRMNRWLKKGELNEDLINTVKGINQQQHWLVITEPWCGDASHNAPFIQMLSELNPLVSISYELRDSEPHSINQYLTNGTKSIPKLVVRDENNNDLFTWGPRPAGCQKIHSEMTAEKLPFEDINVEIQKWYNTDKGEELQKELLHYFKNIKEAAL